MSEAPELTREDTSSRPAPERVAGYLGLREYALLGDGRSCVLVGSDGAVDWWALPTMDAAPTFGAVLDAEHGGQVVVRPTGRYDVSREYVDGGGVLATTFRTPSGAVRILDSLNLTAGGSLPWSEFARRIEGLEGEVEMEWRVQPGDRFTTTAPWPHRREGTPLITVGRQQLAVVLDQAGSAELDGGGVAGRFTARAGRRALVAVVATDGEPTPLPPADVIDERIDGTIDYWGRWCSRVGYDGPWRDAVLRSALVLKQLTLATTGGLQAAATTSLPEKIGGSRNFDYRFSWVRDTGFALDALASINLRAELHAAMSYLISAIERTAPDIRVFYALSGEPVPATMQSVRLWEGYRGSAPVQIGNNAAKQRQLGTYGDVIEAVSRYVAHGSVLDGRTGRLIFDFADAVCEKWTEPDAGLWELGQERHYTISKIACWAALDRAAQLADDGQVPGEHVEKWRSAAKEIRDYVDRSCWSETKRSYTFYAGTERLDCATLLAGRTGFCGRDDIRLHSTIDAIRAELGAGGPLLYRYSGMRGKEGAFVACSFWLVEALTAAGRLDEARQAMDDMVARASDVGLFSEELDPDSGELLGNIPQALSHLALISAAAAFGSAADTERSG